MTATVEFIVTRAEGVLKVSNAALRFQPTEAMRAEVREQRAGTWARGEGADSTGGSGPGSRRQSARGGEGGSETGRMSRRGDGEDSGSNRAGAGRQSDRGTLWILDQDGKVDVIPVKTGISDGQYTEIEGPSVTEGLSVIAAVTTSVATGATNPFENNRPQDGRRRPRPGF
jgi:HlyD family secretion protein